MKMRLLKDCSVGKAGAVLTSPESWRLAFPVKGCVGVPIDDEAARRIERDIAGVIGGAKERLVGEMTAAGTWPYTPSPAPAKPVESPKPAEKPPEPIALKDEKKPDRK